MHLKENKMKTKKQMNGKKEMKLKLKPQQHLKEKPQKEKEMEKRSKGEKRKKEVQLNEDGDQRVRQKKVRFSEDDSEDEDEVMGDEFDGEDQEVDDEAEVEDEEESDGDEAQPEIGSNLKESTLEVEKKKKKDVANEAPVKEGINSKEAHIEQKKTKKERKMKKNKFYDLSANAKKIWEEARREDCSKERRLALMDNLLKLIKGHAKEIIRAHDTVRVIECIVTLGSDEHRTQLYEELKGIIPELSTLKYSKFFVLKMLRYGNKQQKSEIIASFYGRVTKLMKHTEAASVVEYGYNEVANATQRALLVQEYYGPSFALFKDEKTTTLQQVLEKVTALEKISILGQMKDQLVKLTEKAVFKHSIAHFLFRQFFKHANNDMKYELMESLKPIVVEIVHTKDGARVAMDCIWSGNAKDRKIIIKSFKKFVLKIVAEEHGYLVILAAFDAVDDTKLLERYIISELVDPANALELAKSKNGIKVLEYLLSPRDPRFFHKDIVAILKQGDSNPFSKKERSILEKELKEMASPHLFNLVKNHAQDLLALPSSCLLLMNILTKGVIGNGEAKRAAVTEVVKAIANEGLYYETKGQGNAHIIEKGAESYLFKKLIKHDQQLYLDKEGETEVFFATILVDKVSQEVLRSYVGCNKGCFLLLDLMESKIPFVVDKIRTALAGINKSLSQKTYKGAILLLDKLKAANKEDK